MSKMQFRLIVALALLTLVLAACGAPATGGNTTGTGVVPGTGAETPGAGGGTTTGGGTTGGTAVATTGAGGAAGTGTCVGVDTQQLMTTGQTVYAENCAGCHGEQGEGVGDFPGLAANADITVEDVPALVQAYFAVEAHPRTLPLEDLAGALTYVRGSFGNTAAAICPDQIVVPVP